MQPIVSLSEAKDLLSWWTRRKQVLRFAQDDNFEVRLHTFTFTFFGFLKGRNAMKSA